MVVCETITADYITFTPSMILEIGSTSTYLKDKNIKLKLYEANGVKYYLIADTEKQKVEVFELIEGAYTSKKDNFFQFSDRCQIELAFEGLWHTQ
jgi:Uma2 family endonuclease